MKKGPPNMFLPLPEQNDLERELEQLESSWADHAQGVRTGVRIRRDSGKKVLLGRSLPQVHSEFERLHKNYKRGNKAMLVDAIRLACEENVPIPYWVSDGFCAALDYLDKEPKASLHEALGMEGRYPTTKQKAITVRKTWPLKVKLWEITHELIRAGNTQTAAIPLAARQLGIGQRNAFDWFKEVNDRQNEALAASHPGRKLQRIR